MLQTAAKEGVSPRELADRNVAIFRKMVARMNCSNDDYIRTTEPRHYESSKAIWKRMSKVRALDTRRKSNEALDTPTDRRPPRTERVDA